MRKKYYVKYNFIKNADEIRRQVMYNSNRQDYLFYFFPSFKI